MKLRILTLLMVLAASFAVMNCTSKAGQESKEDTETTKEEVVYACPMHPEITGKEGDTCSKCGMALEKVEAVEGEEHKHD